MFSVLVNIFATAGWQAVAQIHGSHHQHNLLYLDFQQRYVLTSSSVFIGLYNRFSFVMYTQCVISTRDLFWQDHRYLQQPVIISPMLEHQPIDMGQTFVHHHQNHLPENSQHLNAVAASGDWQKADTCWQCHHLLKASISTHSHQHVSQRLNTLCHLNPNHWYPNKVLMRKMMRKMMRMRM